MKDDKIKFIMGLLNNPNTTPAQKEKINELLSKGRDIKKNISIEDIKCEHTDIDIEGINNDEYLGDSSDDLKPYIPDKKHAPQDTYGFLKRLFNGPEGGVKNTTHKFGTERPDYEAFMDRCKREYREVKKQYPRAAIKLQTRVYNFLFKENPSSYSRLEGRKIEIGWSCPEFVEWYKNNNIDPNDKKKSPYFKKMINPFKNSIEIRTDIDENLKQVIQEINYDIFKTDDNCSLDERLGSISFFTDTDILYTVIKKIFENINDFSEDNHKIKVCCKVEEPYSFILSICNIGTKPNKSASILPRNFFGGGNIDILTNLYSLCNFDLLAEFPEGKKRKVMLSDNIYEVNKIYDTDEEVNGFTYVLKFY